MDLGTFHKIIHSEKELKNICRKNASKMDTDFVPVVINGNSID